MVRQSGNRGAIVLQQEYLRTTRDLSVYCNPTAPGLYCLIYFQLLNYSPLLGALFCAVLIAANVINVDEILSGKSIEMSIYLRNKFSINGLVLESWANVPRGSGLSLMNFLIKRLQNLQDLEQAAYWQVVCMPP